MENACLVTDIQKFAVNDGPGFRTNVFLKGCQLGCKWCHNPETIGHEPDLYWKRRLCVQCGQCLTACPVGAIFPPIDPAISQAQGATYEKVDRQKCNGCMECVDACNYDALCVAGRPMTVDEILFEVEQDRPFYDNSGGGMTLSGGEPTLHASFAESLLKESQSRSIHNCLDTNGHCSWETLAGLLPYVDIVLYDVKHLDSAMHKKWTGVTNERILENLQALLDIGQEVWVRMPIVPDFNDSLEYHKKAAQFLAGLAKPPARIDLLPFHNWCQDKYGWLGIDWPLARVEAMEPSFLEIPADMYRNLGLDVTVGGSGFEGMDN